MGAYVEYIGNVEAKDREALLKSINEHCKQIIENTPKDKKVFKKICDSLLALKRANDMN